MKKNKHSISGFDRERLEARFREAISNDNMEVDLDELYFHMLVEKTKVETAPDTSGADKYFLDGFITEEMSDEFNQIAFEFLKTHFAKLKEYNAVAWYNNSDCLQSNPSTAIQRKVLNLIYNAAKSGDQEAIDLICYLYKVFHKKEYKQLKRFARISAEEIMAIDESKYHEESNQTVGRVLGMCNFMGIQLDEKCAFIYTFLKQRHEEIEQDNEPAFINFEEGLFQECSEQVDIWLEEDRKRYRERLMANKKYKRHDSVSIMEDFIFLALEHEGYFPDYIQNCNTGFGSYSYLLSTTYALLKSLPGIENIDYEMVQHYALVLELLGTITTTSNRLDDDLDELFGIADYREDFLDNPLFVPENIPHRAPAAAREVKMPVKAVNVAPVKNSDSKVEDYLQEISELRSKLTERDRMLKELRSLYESEKKGKAEATDMLEKYKAEHEEVVALRNAMYELTEELPEVEQQSLEEMKEYIAAKNIIMVGGNDNWIKKIKQLFPAWQFVSANVSGGFSSNAVRNADKVYFFTDTLGHSNYYRYMQVIRECNVPFGFIHGVNLGGNIMHIYNDLYAEEKD